MKDCSVIAGILAVALSNACAPAGTSAADQDALRRADSTYSAGMRTLDVPGLTTLYAADAAMYPPNEATISGLEAVRQYATAFAAAPGLSMTPRLETLAVSQSGDLGYTVNTVDVSTKDSLGNTATDRLRDVHFWRKDSAGQWRIVHDFWNSERAAAAPAKP